MGTVILKALVGGIAGILVWLIFEANAPHDYYDPSWQSFENAYVFALGTAIGAAIGGISGWMQGGKRHLVRGVLLGGLFGAMGITFGHSVGGQLFQAISPTNEMPGSIIGRTVSFTLMGACLGLAIGGSTLNGKRAVQGMIGGALAGAAGGALFDIVSSATAPLIQQVRHDTGKGKSEVGILGRAFMALILGAVIGLFIGLVERFSRSAWVRLHLGRNEGREWSIDAALTTIGRSETAAIPLFGDSGVAPVHAQIQRQGPSMYVLVDMNSPSGTYVNGQRIQAVPLMPGAQIQIGNHRLEFLMKNAPGPAQAAEMMRSAQSYPMQHAPSAAAAPYQQPYGGGPTSAPSAAASGPAPGSLYSGSAGGPQQTVVSPAQGGMQQTVAYGAPAQPMPTQMSPSAGAALVALDGPLAGQRFPVTGSVTLGRESAQVPMSYDNQASRRHAEIVSGAGFVQVTDMGSTNGTFLNGQRVQSAQARPGDVVKVGSTSFRLEG